MCIFVFPPADSFAADDGLVAYYTFDEGTGEVVSDLSGKANHGKVIGAKFAKVKGGCVLEFDGIDDMVDCGPCESMGITNAVTVSAWVRSDRLPTGEVGIAGKGIDCFGLTFYRFGTAWWYISGGGNNCKASVGAGFWHMITGTYDGAEMRLYVDGRIADKRKIETPIRMEGNFRIGDGLGGRGGGFEGAIDEVRVYNRALAETEIQTLFKATAQFQMARREPVKKVAQLDCGGCSLLLGVGGEMEIRAGEESYVIETLFSYPGERISWNGFSQSQKGAETGWVPRASAEGRGKAFVKAEGARYSVTRSIAASGGRILIEDEIRNRSDEPVGVIIDTSIVSPELFEECRLAGGRDGGVSACSENPTIFLRQKSSSLGIMANDTVSRLQLQSGWQGNVARFGLRRLGIAPGETRTLRWTIYPSPGARDYFDFVNLLRDELGSNFTLQGPFDFFDVTREAGLLADAGALKQRLARKKLKIAALMPWLDYDNFNYVTDKVTTRDEYRAMMRKAAAALKSADPGILCIGCMEGNLVTIPPELAGALYATIPPEGRRQGQYMFTDEQMNLLRKHDLRWNDCLLRNPENRCRYELYYRGNDGREKLPMLAIAVYAAPGNGQHKYWMDQAKFMIEDVGLDGVYIDQFSLAFSDEQRYSHEKWDGVTVEIDPQTGKITRKLTDGALAGVGARGDLIRYVLANGKAMVANTHCAAEELQSLPIHRFLEAEWFIDPMTLDRGEEPPIVRSLCEGHLGSPLALGCRPQHRGKAAADNYARCIIGSASAYLRNGLLYCHYNTAIPESGPGAGDYGPINHMFPITPVRLGDGFIEGRERVATCVSGAFNWPGEQKPKALLFDGLGRLKEPGEGTFEMVKSGNVWIVKTRIADWEEMAVLEP